MPRPQNLQARSKLLLVGAELIGRHGFNATGVQDIASAAAIPKGSFYSYFASKEAFVVAILDDYWAMIDGDYGPVLKAAEIPPLARLDDYFTALIALHERTGFQLGCLIGNLALEVTATSQVVRARLAAIFAEWTDALAACLGEAQRRREITRATDLDQLARALIEAFEGAVMRAKVERDGAPLGRFKQIVLPALVG